ncbi:MAG: hypothetical protein QM496_19675 [Verrucomicrobiota bacterium]
MNSNSPQHTTITNIDIPFGRLVAIIFKIMLAAIPAVMLFYVVFGAIMLVIMMIFGGGAAILSNFIDVNDLPETLPMSPTDNGLEK